LREIVRHRAKARLGAVTVQGRDPRGVSQVRCADHHDRSVRGVPGGSCSTRWALPTPYRAPDRVVTPGDGTPSSSKLSCSPELARVPAGGPTPATPRCKPFRVIGQVLAAVFPGRDRRRAPLRRTREVGQLVWADPHTPRVRRPRPPWPDHENRAHGWCAGQRWSRSKPCPRPPSWGRCGTGSPTAEATNIGAVAAARKQVGFVYYALARSPRPGAATEPPPGECGMTAPVAGRRGSCRS